MDRGACDNILLHCDRCVKNEGYASFREHLAVEHLGLTLFSCDCAPNTNFFNQETAQKHRLFCGQPLKLAINISTEKIRQLDEACEIAMTNFAHKAIFGEMAVANKNIIEKSRDEEMPIADNQVQPQTNAGQSIGPMAVSLCDVDPYALENEINSPDSDFPILPIRLEPKKWKPPVLVEVFPRNYDGFKLNAEDPRLVKCRNFIVKEETNFDEV